MTKMTIATIRDNLPKIPRRKAWTCPACGQIVNGIEYEKCPGCLAKAINKAKAA